MSPTHGPVRYRVLKGYDRAIAVEKTLKLDAHRLLFLCNFGVDFKNNPYQPATKTVDFDDTIHSDILCSKGLTMLCP